ncbi:MAG: zinc ribbon domain-containing protein [Lachnospiraceae bacterium]|nr:zinc ribbon domain-containing protein [Lachnospiraceae bacterium]
MKCPNCGNEIPDNQKFCTVCGTPLTEDARMDGMYGAADGTYSSAADAAGAASGVYSSTADAAGTSGASSAAGNTYDGINPAYIGAGSATAGSAAAGSAAFDPNTIPADFRPLSTWAYFGYQLLFSLPIVGFVCLLIFSFGGTHNRNLRNFARSYFCMFIIVVLLILILAAIGGFAYFYSY